VRLSFASLRPVQTPSVVARATSAVDSSGCQSARGRPRVRAQERPRRDGTKESDRSAGEKGGEARREAKPWGTHPTVVGYESTESVTRPSAAVPAEVLWIRCGWVEIPTNK